MAFLREIWRYMGTRKKFWLAPILLTLLLFGVLLILAQSTAVAPFIYTLF